MVSETEVRRLVEQSIAELVPSRTTSRRQSALSRLGARPSLSAPTTAGSRSRRGWARTCAAAATRCATAAPFDRGGRLPRLRPRRRGAGGARRMRGRDPRRRRWHRLLHGGQQGARRARRPVLRPVVGAQQPRAQSRQRPDPRRRPDRRGAGPADRGRVAGHALGARAARPAGGEDRRDRAPVHRAEPAGAAR